MSQMSPLLVLILKVIRVGMLGMSALMLLFLGLGLWQKHRTAGLQTLTQQDYTFFVILVLIGLAGLWMARAVTREINNSGS